MANKTTQKKKKMSGLWVWIIILLIGALSNLESNTNLQRTFFMIRAWFYWVTQYWAKQHQTVLLAVCAGLVFAVVLLLALRRAAKRRKVEIDQPMRAGRTSAAVRRPDPRTRSFTAPEPSCIVCDHTGEDHFRRDKANRIAQLDEWLKNGLIDREEYKVMKSRYEQDL